MNLPVVCLITATHGRHKCVERIVRFVLDQDYQGKIYHLIYNNACISQRLNKNLPEDKFILVNNCHNKITGQRYENLGQIYRDAITFIPEDAEVVNMMDDDDIFLPAHVSSGINGLLKGGKTAYKPDQSYYRDRGNFVKMVNTFEPSIFVRKDHILKYGFADNTTEQHLQWVHPLIESGEIFCDPDGESTLIYDWSQEIPTYKTSGDFHNPKNFENCRAHSDDHGDGIITPATPREVSKYYKMVR